MGALKFRVLLDNSEGKEIFRDILINEEATFDTFFKHIMHAFNFEGEQLASFYVSNETWDKGHEIGLMDMSYGTDEVEPVSVMSETRLIDLTTDADQRFILVYDFLRMWIFLVELIEKTADLIEVPKTLISVGLAPPEDSRGMDETEFGSEFGDDDFDDDDDMDEDDNEFEDGYNEEDYNAY